MSAVRTRALRKSYRGIEAVRGLDLTVEAGETFGFLGPNGAGKSTTIAMLCTLLRPSAGTAEVAGLDVGRFPHRVRRRIGVVFQESTSDRDLTAAENLRFTAELYGMSRHQARRRADALLALVDLAERRDHVVSTFSGGMRRRLEIARALVHEPPVLFLDEPTAGLDPQSRARVWEQLHTMRRQRDITLFLTTHYLEEAEHCDRIAVIDDGRVVAEGTPSALKSALGADIITLSTSDDPAAAGALRETFGHTVVLGPDGLRLAAPDGTALVPRLCAGLPVTVRSVAVSRPSLDDVFLHHTGRTIRDAATAANLMGRERSR